jgi:K+-sensing histidine kinase KdpD
MSRPSNLVRYGSASLLIGCGAALNIALSARWETDPFFTFYIPIIIASLVFGFGPAQFATVISVMVAWFFFVPPVFSFSLARPDAEKLILFFFTGSLMAMTIGLRGRRHETRLPDEYLFRGRWVKSQLSGRPSDISSPPP